MRSPPTRTTSFSRYPLLWLASYFAGGIALGRLLDPDPAVAVALAVIVIAAAASFRSFAGVIIPLLFFPLGTLCILLHAQAVANDRLKTIYADGRIESGEPVEIEGVLLGMPEPAFGGMFLTLRAEGLAFKGDGARVSGTIRLFAPAGAEDATSEYASLDLRYGSRIRVMCRLEREDRFRNPGVKSRIEILDEQGIDATATVKSPLLVEKLGEDPVFLPMAWVYERRQHLIAAFREKFSERTAGVMIASLLGDKHFLDRQTAEVFRDGGTFHVLVISGLHITFIGGLTIWAVSLITRRKVWQAILSSTFLWAYTLAVGAEVPVVRASLMFSFLLFSNLIHREGSLLNALGACSLLLLAWRPADLFSASFQLTVVSVAAIVAGAVPLIEKLRAVGGWMPTATTPLPPCAGGPLRRLCEFLYWNDTAWRIENRRQIWSANLFKTPYLRSLAAPNLKAVIARLFEGAIVSMIVQIWMLPFLVIYFHRVSPGSVLMNLWVGVLIALESFVAVLALMIGGVSEWLSTPLVLLAEFLNSAMMWLPSRFSSLEIASLRVAEYSGPLRVVYLLFALTVVGATAALFRWDPFRAGNGRVPAVAASSTGFAAFLAFVIIFHPYSSPRETGYLRIDFLDVGQGDSALVTFPNGVTMLVDGGGRVRYSDDEFEPDVPRIGESVVSEFLWEKGYSRIDFLLATHADTDHMQGLTDVARNFEIGAVIIGQAAPEAPEYSELLRIVEHRAILLRIVSEGDRLSIGGAEIEILNPAHENDGQTLSTNNASVVMRIAFGDRRFLLTGDIEQQTELRLQISGDAKLRSDVVKVAHHGSRTSSTESFVRSTGPRFAIVSVGKRSRFGHPHREVVDRWNDAGSEVITTGQKGTITILTDGRDLTLGTFVP